MKKSDLIRVSVILVFLAFASCDLIDKATEVSFDTSVPVTFNVVETASNPTGKSYSDTKTLNVASDPDVAKYASKIKEFKVNKVTYTVYFSSPPSVNFSNGTIKVVSSGKTIASTGTISLSNFSETQLTTDAAGISDLASKLLDDKQETIQLQGTLSSTPVTFTVTFTFYLTIKASAL